MDFMTSFRICGTGLSAQRAKLDVITSNITNAETTRTPEGGPYRRRNVVLEAEAVDGPFDSLIREAVRTVRVSEVAEDPSDVRMVYDPSHPDANAGGFVAMPNVNLMAEMAAMIASGRAYEACVTATDATKNMAMKTMDIGR